MKHVPVQKKNYSPLPLLRYVDRIWYSFVIACHTDSNFHVIVPLLHSDGFPYMNTHWLTIYLEHEEKNWEIDI